MSMLFDTPYMFNHRPLQMALWKPSASPLRKHIFRVNNCSWSQIGMKNKVWVACKWALQSVLHSEHLKRLPTSQWSASKRCCEVYCIFLLLPGTNYKRLAPWFNSNFVIILSLRRSLARSVRLLFSCDLKTIAGRKRWVNTGMGREPRCCNVKKALIRRCSAVMRWPHLHAFDEMLSVYTEAQPRCHPTVTSNLATCLARISASMGT